MDHQYDTGLAEVYTDSGELPERRYAEFPTFLDVTGSVCGQAVLDVACGTGILTRLIAGQGARRVVGVDSQAAMIVQARQRGTMTGRIEYRIHDVATMPRVGEFDIATAAWLFNYATSRDELAAMCTRIADNVRPGGKIVATIPNPDYDPAHPLDARYGVTMDMDESVADGGLYAFTLHLNGQSIAIAAHLWTIRTIEEVLVRTGFGAVAAQPCLPSTTAIHATGEEFWQPWIANPPSTILAATRF